MNEKAKTAFYGAGLSLVVGYLVSIVARSIIQGMSVYLIVELSMPYDDFANLIYFTPNSIRIAGLLCACIFLAIAFYSKSETVPFIFSLVSIALLLGSYVPDILINADLLTTYDPTILSATILHCLFWVSFFVLLILCAISLKHDTESNEVKSLRWAFFILFGLSVLHYFLNYLAYHITSTSTEALTAYSVFYYVFYAIEVTCAVAAGILLIVTAKQK